MTLVLVLIGLMVHSLLMRKVLQKETWNNISP